MHSLVRRFIKTGIGFLVTGLALGAWMMARRELWLRASTPYEISAHTHLIVVGFIMMMIMGVALWLFPRPEKTDGRYQPMLADVAYWAITIGTAGRAIGEWLRASTTVDWLRWTVVTAGLLQVIGIVLFFFTMWTRIRPVGSQLREARGERF
jgi:predicted small integral membrane protein